MCFEHVLVQCLSKSFHFTSNHKGYQRDFLTVGTLNDELSFENIHSYLRWNFLDRCPYDYF